MSNTAEWERRPAQERQERTRLFHSQENVGLMTFLWMHLVNCCKLLPKPWYWFWFSRTCLIQHYLIFSDHPNRYEISKWGREYAGIYFRANHSSFPTSRDGVLPLLPTNIFSMCFDYTFLFNSSHLVIVPSNFFLQVERVASMLNYFLLQLVGPQRKSLSLKDPEKYEFRPRELLKQVHEN